jgi:hypothetical protein
MTGDPKHADSAARAELWQDCLYRFLQSRPTSDAERHHAALDRLAELQGEAAKAENPSSRQEIVGGAMVLLQLLVAEVGAPFLELMIGPRKEATGVPDAEAADRIGSLLTDDPSRARGLLLDLIQQQHHACRPLHRRSLDPAVLILPQNLLAVCFDALAARDLGEMHPFLRPPRGQKKPKDAWSRGLMRLRALEHVEFLNGQGWKKVAAYFEVRHALGDASAETVRWWRADLLPLVPDLDARLDTARKAGELAFRLKHDPDFGNRPGETIDAHVELALRKLRDDEPLASFGERYRRDVSHGKQ